MKGQKKCQERSLSQHWSAFFLLIVIFVSLMLGCSPPSTEEMNKKGGPGPGSGSETDSDSGSRAGIVSDATLLPKRIISTVPSITEIMYELQLEDRLVGVSQFCNYPEAAKSLPRIGGLFDPNYEEMIRLKPDLIIFPKENRDFQNRLDSLGIRSLSVDHDSILGILESFECIDRVCRGAESKIGVEYRSSFEQRLKQIQERTKNRRRPAVLISIDRMRDGKGISNVYIAGNNPFYNLVIELAGGDNIAKELLGAVPVVSAEGVRDLNPEIIIDLSTDGSWLRMSKEEIDRTIQKQKADWETLGVEVRAVKNGRIYPILADYATIPGPRILLFIEQLADIFQK